MSLLQVWNALVTQFASQPVRSLSKAGSYSINWINSEWQLESRLAVLQCIALPLAVHVAVATEKSHVHKGRLSGMKKVILIFLVLQWWTVCPSQGQGGGWQNCLNILCSELPVLLYSVALMCSYSAAPWPSLGFSVLVERGEKTLKKDWILLSNFFIARVASMKQKGGHLRVIWKNWQCNTIVLGLPQWLHNPRNTRIAG